MLAKNGCRASNQTGQGLTRDIDVTERSREGWMDGLIAIDEF